MYVYVYIYMYSYMHVYDSFKTKVLRWPPISSISSKLFGVHLSLYLYTCKHISCIYIYILYIYIYMCTYIYMYVNLRTLSETIVLRCPPISSISKQLIGVHVSLYEYMHKKYTSIYILQIHILVDVYIYTCIYVLYICICTFTHLIYTHMVAKMHKILYVAGLLCCRSLFAREPLITGLFCRKRHVKIRHPLSLRDSVCTFTHLTYIHVHLHTLPATIALRCPIIFSISRKLTCVHGSFSLYTGIRTSFVYTYVCVYLCL